MHSHSQLDFQNLGTNTIGLDVYPGNRDSSSRALCRRQLGDQVASDVSKATVNRYLDQRRPVSLDSTQVVAAIDCGTNSTRLLIMNANGVSQERLMRITRLGQGVDAAHELQASAVERTLGVLEEFRRTMDRWAVQGARMVATSAVRDAINGNEFLSRASRTVDIEAELLSGEEEGYLAYQGATKGLGTNRSELVVDIGGGSTELICSIDDKLEVVSLRLGCVRVSERYFQSDPPTAQEIDEAEKGIDEELRMAKPVISAFKSQKLQRVVGLAGTVSTLAALHQRLDHYDRDRLHHTVLTQEVIKEWSATLASLSAQERGSFPGMTAGREDVIVGGAMILLAVMRVLDAQECLTSEEDILDGLAFSLLPTTSS
jgi:exopolyphosphatase/guanosine-5'-triphosphate,3'-diphosphate pyrophosphatase